MLIDFDCTDFDYIGVAVVLYRQSYRQVSKPLLRPFPRELRLDRF